MFPTPRLRESFLCGRLCRFLQTLNWPLFHNKEGPPKGLNLGTQNMLDILCEASRVFDFWGNHLHQAKPKNYDEVPIFPTSRKFGDVVFFLVHGG